MDMGKVGDLELTDAEDFIDKVWGKKGTPERDRFERRVAKAVRLAKRRRRKRKRKTRCFL